MNLRKPTIIFFFTVFLLAVFLLPRPTLAATSTVRGAAWWGDTNEYLFMDCLDDFIGDLLDVSGNLYALPEPRGFHFSADPCSTLIHHVYLDDNGNFSGEAFNYTKGLVSFSGTTTPPEDGYGFNSHCPSTCNSSNSCWACYDETDQKVYGWARVVSDGTWIRLDSATTTPVKLQSWDQSISVLLGHGILPGDFVGNATTTADSVSFNCKSEGGGAGNCAIRDYKVYIQDLKIGHMSAPNWSYSEACSVGALRAVLKWDIKSGTQTGYEVMVSDNSTTTPATAVCWSGVKTGTASQYSIPNADPNCPSLNYDTDYYWWVRLYDATGPTAWYQFGANPVDTATDGNPDSNALTFTTYKHEFPSPFFTWSPYDVLVGTSTEFTSASSYYASGNPALPMSCGGPNCSYAWSTTDAGAIISHPNSATTSIIFEHATGTSITLGVTDIDSYVCSTSTTLLINYDLPLWREVKAN